MRARPRVTFETAEELASGTFGIATEPETPVEPVRRSIRVEPAPVGTVPSRPCRHRSPSRSRSLEPEPVQEALPDVLASPGLEPDAESGPADYEIGGEPLVAADPAPIADIDADFEDVAAPDPDPAPTADPAPREHDLPSAPSVPGFPASAPAAGPAPFLPVPAPPVPTPPRRPPVAGRPPARRRAPRSGRPSRSPSRSRRTQTVSAAEAARAGLAHATDALVVGGHRYVLSGPVTVIGRSSACDVPLDDASASRRHAELRRRGGKTVLVDLDSTNGTLVNGRRVREAPLRPGDRITIGTTAIVFERST